MTSPRVTDRFSHQLPDGLISESNHLGQKLSVSATDVVRLVLSQGLKPAVVEIVLGLGGAYLASNAIRSMPYNVEGLDATTLVAAAGLLLVVTMVATLVPARRASGISPVTTVQME